MIVNILPTMVEYLATTIDYEKIALRTVISVVALDLASIQGGNV